MLKLCWKKPKITNLRVQDTRQDTFSKFDGMESCPSCEGLWVWDISKLNEDGTSTSIGYYNHGGVCLENQEPSTLDEPMLEEVVPLS